MRHIAPVTSKGPEEWFTGCVYPTFILAGEGPSRVRVGSVHFAPSARTAWHSHALGQYLHIVEGTALVQERGGEVVAVTSGQTIYTPPDVEHWHGASPDSFMVHLTIWEASPEGGVETTWGAHVTDDEYENSRFS